METQAATTGIATIKPKRKYTKRKPKLAVVKPIRPTVKKELPKTARAYLRTLGIGADKEGTAISELIKMHHALNKAEAIPEYKEVVVEEPKSFLRRWFVGYGK
jgi:hypothetical protein